MQFDDVNVGGQLKVGTGVCAAIKEEYPHAFANGGDRKDNNVPEVALCEEMGIELIWNVGGGKIQSSSDLVRESKNEK